MKKLICLGLALTALASPALAERRVVSKVILLTTTSISESEVAKEKKAAGKSQFSYFKLDESQKIQSYFQSAFPRELLDKSEKVKMAYLGKHITPKIKAYAPDIMRSEMGLVLAKMYRIERIPAVIINDKFITYGLSVEDSMKSFFSQGK